jgi:hypothetical protein
MRPSDGMQPIARYRHRGNGIRGRLLVKRGATFEIRRYFKSIDKLVAAHVTQSFQSVKPNFVIPTISLPPIFTQCKANYWQQFTFNKTELIRVAQLVTELLVEYR